MRFIFAVLAAVILVGTAVAQGAARPDPRDSGAKAAPVEYRSAFEGYRPYADQALRDWRRSNAEVRDAGGDAGHRSRQGSGRETSKPQPDSPEAAGGHEEHHK